MKRLRWPRPPLILGFVLGKLVERYMFTDCQETWETFDYQPRKPELMISDAIRWLLHTGEIKADRAAQLADRFPPDPEWGPIHGT